MSPERRKSAAPRFDMTLLIEPGRFHLIMDAVARLPQAGGSGTHLRGPLKERLVEREHVIERYGEKLPEIRNGKWHT